MKNRFFTVMMLLVLLVSLTGNAQATPQASVDPKALVYVDISSPEDLNRFASTRLPMYALLDGGLLTGANLKDQQLLKAAGLSFQVLDSDLRAGTYYLAETRTSRPAPDFASFGVVLLNTTHGALLRMEPSQVDALAQAGAELKQISLTPKPLPSAQSDMIAPDAVDPDPLIQGMIDQVTTEQVYQYDRELAGELPVWVDGAWYTITSRYTYSNTPIEKTMHYVGQHMEELGLGVEYHQWGGVTYPNVIGEIPGLVNPENIYIIGAHIDDVQGTPGADDNASGSVATLLAADILSQYQWGCTLRFALWTGEEQGLNGSHAYAQRAYNNGENILGYLNLDMIAWNTIGSQPGIDLIYNPNMPPTQALAQLFDDVVDAYTLNLTPQLVTDLGGGSDHSSFWDYGYTAILSIEDQSDFNPYYHGPGDTPAHTDPSFFTDFVKASIATFAHKSDCLIPSGLGALDGHVTAESGGAPIEGASIIADDGQGHDYPATTDASGYYTRTLMADTYTVTTSAYGYMPASIDGVEVVTDTITTQDFSLISAPTYIVSGTVTESGTGLPLLADITIEGSPVTAFTDPNTGFYSAELPQGEYLLKVHSSRHLPQERPIVLESNQTQNFILDPLPCILLVDDDNDAPNTTPFYTAALDNLGYEYNIFNTGGGAGPALDELQGYQMVLWYSGDAYGDSAGPNSSDENNLSTYLDEGGKLFLDSQDYLYDFGLTTFGQTYLGISSFTNDTGDATSIIGLAGDPIGDGLGPFNLTYPAGFSDYGDIVNPATGASTAFKANNNVNKLDIDKEGDNWNTVFFGTSWVSVYNNNSSNGELVLQRMLDWFGGCQVDYGILEGHVVDADTSAPLEGVLVTVTPGIAGIQSITDPTGYYSMTLQSGTYTATASLDGYVSQSQITTIIAGETTTVDFSLEEGCDPVSEVDFSWLPAVPVNGEMITFTASASGTAPIDFHWSFGDTFTGTGSTMTHSYLVANTYTVELAASNACSNELASKNISIIQKIWQFFLPLLNKN